MKIPAAQLGLRAKQAHEADSAAKFILLSLPLDAFDEDGVDVEAARWPVVSVQFALGGSCRHALACS